MQYVNGSHTIDPAPLQVRAGDVVTRYGQVPSFNVRYYGLRNGDTAPATVHVPRVVPDGGPMYGDQVAATASTDAGELRRLPRRLRRATTRSYPVAGNWTVEKAPLSITVDSVTTTWGDRFSPYHTDVRGLVNGDTRSDLTTVRVRGPGGTPDVGTYPLTLSGGTSPNYETKLWGRQRCRWILGT